MDDSLLASLQVLSVLVSDLLVPGANVAEANEHEAPNQATTYVHDSQVSLLFLDHVGDGEGVCHGLLGGQGVLIEVRV